VLSQAEVESGRHALRTPWSRAASSTTGAAPPVALDLLRDVHPALIEGAA
jgi:hypothetical protein